MNIKELKLDLQKDINDNPQLYPFISIFWEIDLINELEKNKNQLEINFGHFETNSNVSISFYKPISKIINLSEFI